MATLGISSIALLSGSINMARSAVFEQMDNGRVVQIDGGVSVNTPPSNAQYNEFLQEYLEPTPAILAGYPGKEQPDPVRPTGAVLVDLLPDASPQATRAAWRGPVSP